MHFICSRQHVPPIKLKIKTKVGRGYNPSLVNYKESEYHYGSDFDDDDADESDSKNSKSEDSSEEDSDTSNEQEDLIESDVDFDAEVVTRPSTPVPFWLRTDEDIPGILSVYWVKGRLRCRQAFRHIPRGHDKKISKLLYQLKW